MPPTVPSLAKNWPSPQDWQAAIQNPHTAFTDAFLRGATAAVDHLGLPTVWSGNFAYVFKVANGQERRAIRCFGRFVADRQERYEAIDRQLDAKGLPALVAFDYDADGIRVNGSCYPVLVMEWIEGNTLDVYIDQVVHKPTVLEYLAEEWAQWWMGMGAANGRRRP